MSKESISSKLTELFELLKDGAITQKEYDQLKSEIINDTKNNENLNFNIQTSSDSVTSKESSNLDKTDSPNLKRNKKGEFLEL